MQIQQAQLPTMKRFYRVACCLVLISSGRAYAGRVQSEEVPPPAQQQKLLEQMRDYASQYIDNLPNFVCRQMTEQLEAGKNPKRWRQGETLVSRLVFSDGKEQQTLELVNGRPPKPGHHVTRPLRTEGEFGILLANVLNPSHGAQLGWSRWETVNGRHLAVFEYLIDKEHSTVHLSLGDIERGVTPYRGFIFANPENGEVWRITHSLFDIPAGVRTKSLNSTIDYGPVQIGDTHYLLPVEAAVFLDTGSGHVVNRYAFREYQKFDASSTITFETESAHSVSQNGKDQRSR